MKEVNTLIIGSGFAGLCMGIQMKLAGRHDFLIVEKAETLGGTWRENTYPGAECDIPSALYSYSFEHNADWQFIWSGQEQILKYQQDTAEKYGLLEHLEFSKKVARANYDEGYWLVSCESGAAYRCQHLVSAVGQLHHVSIPKFGGAESFIGQQFHSAGWDHSVDLKDKKIAVIGNAASAVQFVPEIAKIASSVTVYQRSPNWILPKVDRGYSSWEQKLSARLPLLANLNRGLIWAFGEWIVFPAIKGRAWARALVKKLCLRNMYKHIKDEALQAKLTPEYPIGAKRILFSDQYYNALSKEHVHLDVSGIKRITANGIQNRAGDLQEADIIIYGTGFRTNPFLADIDIRGLNDLDIRDHWSQGAHAYLGVATHGFPNLHILYGPNTNLGHSSIIMMIEAQVRYVLRAMDHLDSSGKKALEIKFEIENEFNQRLQAELASLAFSQIDKSWYIDRGRVTNNWSKSSRSYLNELRRLDFQHFNLY